MFFSLFFICTCLWTLDYLRFTKYGLVFMWLTVTANKFMKGVFYCRQNFSNTKKVITCKYHQNNMLWNTLCIFQMWGKYGEKIKDFSKDTNEKLLIFKSMNLDYFINIIISPTQNNAPYNPMHPHPPKIMSHPPKTTHTHWK